MRKGSSTNRKYSFSMNGYIPLVNVCWIYVRKANQHKFVLCYHFYIKIDSLYGMSLGRKSLLSLREAEEMKGKKVTREF